MLDLHPIAKKARANEQGNAKWKKQLWEEKEEGKKEEKEGEEIMEVNEDRDETEAWGKRRRK